MSISRRECMGMVGAAASVALGRSLAFGQDSGENRPNILWITVEDLSPLLGCYGDDYADTPNLDKLAREGILFKNAFANCPVCAPARSSLITGMYACSLGTQHMRSRYPVPDKIKFYPHYLREAGYFCTNHRKTDYNIAGNDGKWWDQCGSKASWKNRKPGQPFFSIINLTTTHEHCIHKAVKTEHNPKQAPLPPYHPDTREFRHDWAQYYDKITKMDSQVGGILNELEQDGLADDTIIFFYGDHGGILGRSKRFPYDSGMQVPLIMRFPKKYENLAPAKAGDKYAAPVSFIDLTATALSLAGVRPPEYMQGHAIAGEHKSGPDKYAFGFRGRMDGRYDMARTIRDERYRYIRNYMPHLPWGQHLNYLWRAPSMRAWEKLHNRDRLNDVQNAFFEPKPAEQLFDTKTDPHCVNNLAGKANHAVTLRRMRHELEKKILQIHDAGFLHEAEMLIRSQGSTSYEVVRDREKYDLKRLVHAADVSTSREPGSLKQIMKFLDDDDSGVRYWGAIGTMVLGEEADEASDKLTKLLEDSSPSVRIAAAESLCGRGRSEKGLPVLLELLRYKHDSGAVASKVRLHAANALENIGSPAKAGLKEMKEALKAEKDNYVKRALGYTVKKPEG